MRALPYRSQAIVHPASSAATPNSGAEWAQSRCRLTTASLIPLTQLGACLSVSCCDVTPACCLTLCKSLPVHGKVTLQHGVTACSVELCRCMDRPRLLRHAPYMSAGAQIVFFWPAIQKVQAVYAGHAVCWTVMHRGCGAQQQSSYTKMTLPTAH
jgi:hypothetical protein